MNENRFYVSLLRFNGQMETTLIKSSRESMAPPIPKLFPPALIVGFHKDPFAWTEVPREKQDTIRQLTLQPLTTGKHHDEWQWQGWPVKESKELEELSAALPESEQNPIQNKLPLYTIITGCRPSEADFSEQVWKNPPIEAIRSWQLCLWEINRTRDAHRLDWRQLWHLPRRKSFSPR